MTHRGPFQPLPFCDSVILHSSDASPVLQDLSKMMESGSAMSHWQLEKSKKDRDFWYH